MNGNWNGQFNVRIISTYPPKKCGIGLYAQHLVEGLCNKKNAGKVAKVQVAALMDDESPELYHSPVDITFRGGNPADCMRAMKEIIAVAKETPDTPTVILAMHDFGLGVVKEKYVGTDGYFDTYVKMLELAKANDITSILYLHTLHAFEDEIDEYEVGTLKALDNVVDGTVVHSENSESIYTGNPYNAKSVIQQIAHGIRDRGFLENDRLAIKNEMGLDSRALVGQYGLQGVNKGSEYFYRAFWQFLNDSCDEEQRNNIKGLRVGGFHEKFVAHEGGKHFKAYMDARTEVLNRLRQDGMRIALYEEPDSDFNSVPWDEFDLAIFDRFADEDTELSRLHTILNVGILPYMDLQQDTSGIVTDHAGYRRTFITTKFNYALEYAGVHRPVPEGIIGPGDPRMGCILVDPGEPSVEQIAKGLDYLLISPEGQEMRLKWENVGHQKSHRWGWPDVADDALKFATYLYESKHTPQGRVEPFQRIVTPKGINWN